MASNGVDVISPLHILIFPFLAQGHLLPSIQMAKLFASRGATVKITILTTPANSIHFQILIQENPNIHLHLIPFPLETCTGLPSGCENMSQVPVHLKPNFFAAMKLFRQPFAEALEALHPNAVITGYFFPWTTEVAAEHGVPRLAFSGSNYFTRCAGHSVALHNITISENHTADDDGEYVAIPGLPHDIRMLRSQIPDFNKIAPFLADMINEVNEAEAKSYGLIVNSFYELEPDYADYSRNVIGRKSWHVGPMLLCNKPDYHFGDDDMYLKTWLDSKTPHSVLYVCFGSVSDFSTDQLHQLALGLEATECSFVWVVRKGGEEALPEGFEERVGERGLVVKGWAPQILILNHAAVGGFLTHCGWNSSLEGITAGLPFVTWPLFADQFYNERLIVDVLKIGVAVGAKEYAWKPEDRSLVEAVAVAKAVSAVMSEGEEAEGRRRKAKVLGEMARKAMEEGGSSYIGLSNLIQELRSA